MAKVDLTLTNWVIVGLLAFTFIVVGKMAIRAFPTPAIVRQAADIA